MKELSIEEKAKRYDEVVKKAESLYKAAEPMSGCNVLLETVFPELKESEDEKIRKELLNYLYDVHDDDEERAKWIAYLEKQGEYANFRNKIQIGDKVTRNRDGVLVNLSQLNRVAKKDEKQGEQKPNYNNKELKDVVIAELSKYNSNDLNAPWATDSTGLQYPLYFANLGAKWQGEQKPDDKKEHKFKVGDEIKAANEESLTITKIDDKGYWSVDLFICDFDEECLWDLVEQKPAWSEEDALGDNIDDARVLDELI